MDKRTLTPNFWLHTNGYRTMNLIEPSLDFLNYSSNRLERHFFVLRTDSNFGNRTQTPYFWLQTIEHQTSNIFRPID